MKVKADNIDKKGMFFSGIAYVLVGTLIIFYPGLVYYWVSGGFIVQGISSLIRGWKK